MTSGTKDALREAAMWFALAASLFCGVFFFDEISSLIKFENFSASPLDQAARPQQMEAVEDGFDRSVRLKAGRSGHFYTDALINDKPIGVIVDTGATFVSLKYEHAQRAGILPAPQDFKYRTRTANGIAKIARVRLNSVRIGDIVVRDVDAAISEPGKLPYTLLGMSFLGKIKNVSLANGELILTN